MKHVYRENNQEADHWAIIGAQGQRKILLDRRDVEGGAGTETVANVDVVW